ncbi:DUF2835 family protein [Agaribacterium sp. ZY112]|uniref:DUF2835 family protein n=1 Tax=Agaribacterium sp. ZY112 TaxID=3233574 RepID=UPI003523E963
MRQYIVNLSLSAEEFQKLYQGRAQSVIARSQSGERLRFPASSLRPYVGYSGIKGCFEILVDNNSKLVHIRRL